MLTIPVDAGDRSYDIIIGRDVISETPRLLDEHFSPDAYIVITDEDVDAIYGDTFMEAMSALDAHVSKVVIHSGEQYKNPATYLHVIDALSHVGATRESIVVAFGGGVVGDTAGFAAATYMRGIRYVQVPTTLVAQIDSSFGGKVGVDTEAGKNMLGAFWQPSLVLIDTSLLDTLPAEQLRSGMAEVVKCAALYGEKDFAPLEELVRTMGPDEAVSRIVSRPEVHLAPAIRFKAELVSVDPLEQGRRRILNFGHTLGQALERATDFTDYSHGEALGWGMVTITQLAETMNISEVGTAERLRNVLTGLGLELDPVFEKEAFREALGRDKKSAFGQVRFVLLESIGRSGVVEVPLKDLLARMGLLD